MWPFRLSCIIYFCFRFTSMAIAWHLRNFLFYLFFLFFGLDREPTTHFGLKTKQKTQHNSVFNQKCLIFTLNWSVHLSTFVIFILLLPKLQSTSIPNCYFFEFVICRLMFSPSCPCAIKHFYEWLSLPSWYISKTVYLTYLEFSHYKWCFEICSSC